MINPGLVLKELRLVSDNKPSAKIFFEKGLNVISGPSNCGKSYIFQCINYMLGASTIPKSIKEAQNYHSILLEINDSNDDTYTLRSSLSGGNLFLYKKGIDDISENDNYTLLNRKHHPDKEDTISAFLLKLNNLFGKKIRTNANGKTRNLSYRDVIRFLMVNEERILTEQSVIESHYTKKTEESSVFKLIAFGKDDSSIVQKLTPKQEFNRKGKLELLDGLISDLNNQIANNYINQSIVELESNIDKLDSSYRNLNQNFNSLKTEFVSIEEKRSLELEKLEGEKSKAKVLKELLSRSSILKKQYETDISRLKSTIETSSLLTGDHTFDNKCPLCNNKLDKKCEDDDILKIIDSCSREIFKINNLLLELKKSETLINSQIIEHNNKISHFSQNIEKFTHEIEDGVGKEIENLIGSIKIITDKRNEIFNAIRIKKDLSRFILQRNEINDSISEKNSKDEYDKLSTSSLTSFSELYYQILKSINFENISSVSYSEESNDFVISGQDRRLFGKGLRAITYACFIVTLQEYVYKKNYSIGVPILDSPLVTYKKPQSEGQEISIDLAMDFYRYISKSKNLSQIIIIENENPPEDIMNNINHIEFGVSKKSLRKGFIPV